MRMRKKKHREDRLFACSHLIIDDITAYSDSLRPIFDNDNPIHIEIGCGKGKFITETAANNPDTNYIAIEKNLDVLVLAAEKIRNANLTNVRFVAGDACVLGQMNIDGEAQRIYINFCDPWKKKRQAKRRLTHANFLALYEKLLAKGGFRKCRLRYVLLGCLLPLVYLLVPYMVYWRLYPENFAYHGDPLVLVLKDILPVLVIGILTILCA